MSELVPSRLVSRMVKSNRDELQGPRWLGAGENGYLMLDDILFMDVSNCFANWKNEDFEEFGHLLSEIEKAIAKISRARWDLKKFVPLFVEEYKSPLMFPLALSSETYSKCES